MDDSTKAAILGRLMNGEAPRVIAESMDDVSYPQVLALRRKLKKAEEENTVAELINLPEAALQQLKQTMADNAPSIPLQGEIVAEAAEIIDNVQALKVTERSMAKAADVIAKQIELKAASTTNTDTLALLGETLAKMYSAMYGKSAIQVNTQINNGDGFESMLTD